MSQMKNMTVKNIAGACGGRLSDVPFDENMEVSSVVIDSRRCLEGCLFIAMRGERVDSHKFIPDCVKAGAALIVAEYEVECGVPLIIVDNALKALEDIAYFYRQQLKLKVVGITGSVGKTSTKEAIAAVLSESFVCLKTHANLNNNIGLPLMVLSIRQEHTAAVLELGISHFGEMVRMSRIAQPDIAVITNIGESHIENLGSKEGILEEKSHIFDFLPEDGCVVVNGDDGLLRNMPVIDAKKYSFSLNHEDSDSYAYNVVSRELEGSVFDLKLSGDELTGVKTPVPGVHSVANAACAALIGSLMGMKREDIVRGLSKINTISGRTNVIKTAEYTIIDDCYNASPSSVKAALELLSAVKGRKVAILGDMFELGEAEKELHSDVGDCAASYDIDVVVAIGKLSENTYRAVCSSERFAAGAVKAFHFDENSDFKIGAKDILLPGDTCLVKASHGMKFGEIVDFLQNGAGLV